MKAILGSRRRHAARVAAVTFATALSVFSAGGCSALVDTKEQCSADADCKTFGYEFTCQAGVCKGAAVPCFDSTGMAGHGCIQSSVTGCYDSATGPTLTQTLNACTDAECVEPTPLSVTPSSPPAPPVQSPSGTQPPAFAITSTTTSCGVFGKPVLLVAGSPTGATLLSELSAAVNHDFVVTYVPMSSCDALAVAARRKALSGFAYYWDPVFVPTLSSARRVCRLVDDTVPTMVVSDIDPSTCDATLPSSLSTGWVGARGPVSYVTVAAQEASTVNALSQEVATDIFGFGADATLGVIVDPFTRPAGIVSDTSAAWLIPSLSGKTLGYGTWVADSAAAAAAVAAGDPLSTLGIMGADAAARANLRTVALRAAGQGCAVLPDSDRTTPDRANVRDGHYPFWFSTRLYSRVVDGQIDASAQVVLDVMAGEPLTGELAINHPTWDVFTRYADRHIVPTCAMRVKKEGDADFGALVPYAPPLGCGCHFDAELGLTPSSGACQACKTDADCPAHQACAQWGTPKSAHFCEEKN
jgi:hypothetical protein